MATTHLSEKQLQDLMIQWLNIHPNVFVWKQNQGKTIREYTLKTGPFRGTTKTHAFRAAGVDGISDIIGMIEGRFVAIEVKLPGNKPRPDQLEFLDNVKRAGGVGLWVKSFSELYDSLKKIFDRKEWTL